MKKLKTNYNMLTLIYPYRNRSLTTVKRSMDSLAQQTVNDFEVQLVDYGSQPETAQTVKKLLEQYSFAHYQYVYTQFQPWNKSRALNSVIKKLSTDYFFVADVDLIFHPQFVERLLSLQQKNTATYFKVGYLSEMETQKQKEFAAYQIEKESDKEATGLTMFPVESIQKMRGFDEFYHFWGAEDTDMHLRFQNNEGKIVFYEEETLLLHQWHLSYMANEKAGLTEELQLGDIIKLNHQHLQFNQQHQIIRVNPKSWGEPIKKVQFERLTNFKEETRHLSNLQHEIEHLLFYELPYSKKILKVVIQQDEFMGSTAYKTKKALGKKVPLYYPLKTVNDMLLRQLIGFYRNDAYIYRVYKKEKRIELTLEKSEI